MSPPPRSSHARAFILAAGRGERMRPLTDHTPKPLLAVRGQPLMQWTMQALARGGFTQLVVNTAWLGEQIADHFGPQPALGTPPPPTPGEPAAAAGTVSIHYSHEGQDFGYALETAGGIARALPLLADTPDDVFWVAAGDVFAPDFPFTAEAVRRFAASQALAHLWLVPNPAHNPKGDFALGADGWLSNTAAPGAALATFSTIGLYKRALFEAPWCPIIPGNPQGTATPLAPLLRLAIDERRVSGALYTGQWVDVGTPERLAQLNAA